MPLFEIAILEMPKAKKDEERGLEKLVFGPACVVAKDSQSAALRCVMDNPDAFKSIDKDRMNVLVRPFA